jgi:predicted PurR-regulated permease PerM
MEPAVPKTKAGGPTNAGADDSDSAREPEATSVRPDPDEADGAVPLIEPPGEPGQSELPGTRIDPKSFSLAVLATLGVAYSLYFARAILFPILFAMILALLFRPVIRRTRRLRIPDSLSAAAVLALILTVIGVGIYELAPPATEFVSSIPQQLDQADEKVRAIVLPFRKINRALETGDRLSGGEFVEKAASEDDGDRSDERSTEKKVGSEESGSNEPRKSSLSAAQRLADEKDRFAKQADSEGDAKGSDPSENSGEIVVRANTQPTLSDWVLSATSTFLGGAVICFVLLYFLLATGDAVLNNVLHVLPNFREKRGVVELIYAAEQGMSRYLLTVTIINVCLGIVEGLLLAVLGVQDAPLWGVMACAFNFVPYVGALTGTIVVALVSFLQFESLGYSLLPPFLYWGVTVIEGNFITPTVLGKQISLNPVMVFLSLAFWGWIWGVGGALIAVPLLAMTKIVCDQFKPLQPIARLLEH